MHVLQGSSSLFMDQFMYTISEALIWVPFYIMLVVLVVRNNDNLREVLLTIGFTLLTFAIVDLVDDGLVKPYFQRWRPSQDPLLKYTIHIVNGYRGGKYGFFSAHAANTMSIAVFLLLLIRSKALSFSLILWSFLNGWSRIYLGVHYPSDVLVGWAFGAFVGCCVYFAFSQTMHKLTPKDTYISEAFTSNGYSLSDCYITTSVLWLTFLYCMLKAVI